MAEIFEEIPILSELDIESAVLRAISTPKLDLDEARAVKIRRRMDTLVSIDEFSQALRRLVDQGLVTKELGESYGEIQIARYFLTDEGQRVLSIGI